MVELAENMTTTGENNVEQQEIVEISSSADGKMSASLEQQAHAAEGDENLFEKTMTLLKDGKRHFVLGNFAEAVELLDECSQLYVKQYGETAPECVEAYLYYGKSLLELENEKMKDQQIVGGIGEEDENEESDDEEEEEEGENENNNEREGEEEKQENNADMKQETKKVNEAATAMEEKPLSNEKQEENGVEAAASSSSTAEKNGVKEEEIGTADDENHKENNLQVAWEMVDLARVILEKMENCDRKRLAECRLVLGEIRYSSEEFRQAIDEFKTCLDLYLELLPDDDRKISDVFFQIGMSYDQENEYEAAAENFRRAADVLKLRKTNLEKTLTESELEKNTKKEVDDLTSLIVEIEQRVVDCVESEHQKIEAKKGLDECIGHSKNGQLETIANNNAAMASQEVTDVSNLVRKNLKRAACETSENNAGDETTTTPEVKKTKENNESTNGCCEEIVNGQQKNDEETTTSTPVV